MVFYLLQNGIYLKEISFGNVSIKNLYLKWNDKLSLSAKELLVQSTASQNDEPSNIQPQTLSRILYPFINAFESIDIEHLQINQADGSLYFTHKNGGALHLYTPQKTELDAQLTFNEHYFVVHLQNFYDPNTTTNANGMIIIDPTTLQSFSKLNIKINNDANLTLYTHKQLSTLNYKVVAHNPIKNPKQIISLFKLPQEIRYWAHDAIELQSLELRSLEGVLDLNDLTSAYKTIKIQARANTLSYRYNKQLDPVTTRYTDLEFKEGVLFIRPFQSTNYGFDTQKSWLKIDFTPKKELLTLYLDFTGQLNKKMLHILEAYKIKLPIEQKQGSVKTKLTITVNLRTIDLDAHGNFYTNEAVFNYQGIDINATNLQLKLDNYKVAFNGMQASIKDTISAKVDLRYDAKQHTGTITCRVDKLAFSNTVKPSKLPLHAIYTIDPKQDTLKLEQSQWILSDDLVMNIDALESKVDLNSTKIQLPLTTFELQDIASGMMEGSINLKTLQALFSIDIFKFHYKGVKLAQSNAHFILKKEKDIELTTPDTLHLDLIGTKLRIKQLNLGYSNNQLYTKNTSRFYFGKFTQGDLFAKYNFTNNTAQFNLRNLSIKNPTNGNIIYKQKQLTLLAHKQNDAFVLRAKKLAISFLVNTHRWRLKLNDLKKLYKNSPLLQRYALDNGSLRIFKYNTKNYVEFSGHTQYRYKLFKQSKNDINRYSIKGKLTPDKRLTLSINEHIFIDTIKDTLKINIKNYTISLPEILRFIQDDEKNPKTKQTAFSTEIVAKNSSLYLGDDKYALADTLQLQYKNEILTAQLFHKKGKASLKLQEDQFHIYGQGFGDQFMDEVFQFSKFKGGKLDFNVEGKIDNFKGIVYISQTKILNYTVLNNLFAFLNTIPSLMTFSVPEYSRNGLLAKNAYMRFHYKNDIYHILDFLIESNELTITAKGEASSKNDTINMDMTLKTDIGSAVSKIPVVGYIIFDGEALSTTVEITGKLSDPSVKSKIAKEVIVAPLNIIKRTIKYPLKLFETDE